MYLINHTAERIVSQLLKDLLVGAHPNTGFAWPIFTSHKPDKPDDCITIYGTTGTTEGRIHLSGELVNHPGIMIHVRGADSQKTSAKCWEIISALDTQVNRTPVTVEDSIYLVQNANRAGEPINLGQSTESSNRYVYSVNYLLTIFTNQ